MQRCDRIYNHPLYRRRMEIIADNERGRKFCLHNAEHAFDVARIGYIMILERGLDISKELFYAAALLHDAGRYSGRPHNESGAELAEQVMPDCGFDSTETGLVCAAIRAHRDRDGAENVFSRVLYEADKLSRQCFRCGAAAECYWDAEKRNRSITF